MHWEAPSRSDLIESGTILVCHWCADDIDDDEAIVTETEDAYHVECAPFFEPSQIIRACHLCRRLGHGASYH